MSVLLSAAVGAGVLVAAAGPVLPHLRTEVLAAPSTIPIGSGLSAWAVPVDEGWMVRRPLFGEDAVLVSPDGAVEVRVAARESSLETAFAAAARDAGVTGDPRREVLASGSPVLHGENSEILVAVVGASEPSRGSGTVELVVHAVAGGLAAYRPTIAALVNGIEMSS